MNVRKTAIGTQRVQLPDPSRGGARGFDVHMRKWAIALRDAGLPMIHFPMSLRTIQRWKKRVVPYKMNGGADPDKSMSWQHLNLLLVYRTVYPDAHLQDLSDFMLYATQIFYSTQEISRAEKHLGLTRKVSSTTAYKALEPMALARMHMFLTMPFPYGRVNIPRTSLVDIDEAGKYE